MSPKNNQVKVNTKKIDELCVKMREFPWEDKEAYARYLAQAFHYVSHSTRLLAAAAGAMDPADEKLFNRFVKHISEEKSHEKLAARDLERLGFSLGDYPELAATRSMYEIQYHKIFRHGPVVLMGYILPLEIVASSECPGIFRRLDKCQEKEASSFIRLHGEEDPDHVEKALDSLKGLDKERLAKIDQNIEQTVDLYSSMLDACSRRG